MANKHLIGKQIIELVVSSSENIYEMQQKMSELVWKDLVPELSNLFDSIVGEDEVVRIDCIQLDLGSINLDKTYSKSEIVTKIVSLLEEKIIEKLQHYKEKNLAFKSENKRQAKKLTGLEKNMLFNEKEKLLKKYLKGKSKEHTPVGYSEAQTEQTEQSTTHQLLRRYYFDVWLHWLEKGALPSYGIVPEKNWMELVLETLAVDSYAIELLENKVRKHPIALERLVLQHNVADLKSLVELYTTISQTKLLTLFQELKQVFSKEASGVNSLSYRELEISAWKVIFENVILERKKLDSIALGVEMIKIPALKRVFRKKLSGVNPSSYEELETLILGRKFLKT